LVRSGQWCSLSHRAGEALLTILFAGSFALAQSADPLAALERTAEQKNTEWDGLAKTLEARVARMLPCDTRVRSSIEEVSRASDARLAALAQYLQAAAAQAHADTQAILSVIAVQEAATKQADVDRAEALQHRIAIEAQLADLEDGLKRRAQLAPAQISLAGIAEMAKQNVSAAQQESERRAALNAALHDATDAYQARERSIQNEMSALAVETSRWTDYYAARLARAQTECSITNQRPSRPARRKKR